MLVFEGDRLTSNSRRLLLGGVAFGFAGAIKVWAIFPVLVLLLLLLCRARPASRLVSRYIAGVVAGFCIPVLPFVILAPRAFYDSVIVAQLSRVDP